jgi:hypothetical protein
MNKKSTISVHDELGLPLPNELVVIFGVHSGTSVMLDLAAHLSLLGPLYVLDFGNRSNMYRVARALRLLTVDPVAKLQNIRLSRSFTCYQVVSLLEKLSPDAGVPVLVLDLVATFLDESVPVIESQRLFKNALLRLFSLSRSAPVVVSAKPLFSISSPRFNLLEELKAQAHQVWEESEALISRPADSQLALFAE